MDECFLNIYMCYENGYCNNIKGFYYCICNVGYIGNGIYCFGKRL